MAWIAGIRAEETLIQMGAFAVRFWRARELERFVNAEEQLRAAVPPEPPYWMHLWPGALALARTVAVTPAVGRGRRVLELGCGLGLPALTAAARGACVIASDWRREPLHFLRASAAQNGLHVAALQMDWSAPAIGGRFDVCLGAEVTYDAAAEASIRRGLHAWLVPGGVAWFADSVNTQRRGLAEALRDDGFAVTVSALGEHDDEHRVWVRLIEARRRP